MSSKANYTLPLHVIPKGEFVITTRIGPDFFGFLGLIFLLTTKTRRLDPYKSGAGGTKEKRFVLGMILILGAT
jgi:hypothetical protein